MVWKVRCMVVTVSYVPARCPDKCWSSSRSHDQESYSALGIALPICVETAGLGDIWRDKVMYIRLHSSYSLNPKFQPCNLGSLWLVHTSGNIMWLCIYTVHPPGQELLRKHHLCNFSNDIPFYERPVENYSSWSLLKKTYLHANRGSFLGI